MAYTKFNIISTGDDKAAGSTTGSPVYTSTSGNWDGVSQFTPTDGTTPASSVNVGDYVSVCTNASTATSFVAQVTAVGAGANGTITVSTTVKYGTVLAAQTGTATLKAGGAWASFTPVANFGSGAVPQSTEIDVKAATYTLSASLSLFIAGAATKPVWFRGYNTTVGDLDNGSTTLSYPTISAGANSATFACADGLYTGLSITANRNGAALTVANNGFQRLRRCRVSNTNSGTSASAVSVANTAALYGCYFSAPSTASSVVAASVNLEIVGCHVAGAAGGSQVGVIAASGCSLHMRKCTVVGTGSHGVAYAGGGQMMTISGCTFSSCGGDSVRMSSGPLVLPASVADCAFFASGGYDINNSSGTNTCLVYLDGNLSYSPTSGHLNGFGDWSEFNALVDVTDPRTSSTDLHLLSTSAGAGAGIPGQWENLTAGLKSTPDVGAWQRAVSSGGVSGLPLSRMVGGL